MIDGFILLRMGRFYDKPVEKIETRILLSVKCLRKSCHLLSKVENYRTTGQATDENMDLVHFTLGT